MKHSGQICALLLFSISLFVRGSFAFGYDYPEGQQSFVESALHDTFGQEDYVDGGIEFNNGENANISHGEVQSNVGYIPAENCAEILILEAAKLNVAENFGNSSVSHGECALGVRTSLQRSKVGAVVGGLGNAIDFVDKLQVHGFIDSGILDPRMAPAGAVIVFAGPLSDKYLKNGKFGKPPGDWLGHVTIKGDDGRYYTDGRTHEPALGWVNGRNDQGIRNVVGIFVPNAALIKQFEQSCH